MSALEDEGVRAMLAHIASLEARLQRAEAQLAGIAAGHVVWTYVGADGVSLAGQHFVNAIRDLASDILKLATTDEQRGRLWYCRALVEGKRT